MARFVRQAGYKGLLVNLDEMVNLYKLHSGRARSANYEQILRILNDCLQGSAEGIGFLMGGTPEFVEDQRKGLYSYEALRSRLARNTFADIAKVIDGELFRELSEADIRRLEEMEFVSYYYGHTFDE